MITKAGRNKLRLKRHRRQRRKIQGTAERPRLNVFRSAKHIYAQLLDDEKGVTLASASTLDPELRDSIKNGGNVEAAEKVGQLIGKRAKEKGYTKIIFDRGGYLYHGRVRALADGARKSGLEF